MYSPRSPIPSTVVHIRATMSNARSLAKFWGQKWLSTYFLMHLFSQRLAETGTNPMALHVKRFFVTGYRSLSIFGGCCLLVLRHWLASMIRCNGDLSDLTLMHLFHYAWREWVKPDSWLRHSQTWERSEKFHRAWKRPIFTTLWGDLSYITMLCAAANVLYVQRYFSRQM